MQKSWSHRMYSGVVVCSFFLLLTGFAIAAIGTPDKEISKSERRYYAQMPEWSLANVMDGSYMRDMEDYLLDQFVGRDSFRIAKTEIETSFFGKKDANNYVKVDDILFELDYDWSKKQVSKTAEEFAKLQKLHFSDAQVYYAVIPDKSSFLSEEEYPVGNGGFILTQLKEHLKEASYIDLYPYLSLQDYYKTDLHWKQESILDVAEVLLSQMRGTEWNRDNYTETLITSEFFGAYAGAAAYQTTPDELYGLTSEVIENAVVYDFESNKETSVYAPEKIDGTDAYDYYLWGARALLTIENPLCENGKKLLLFRDSFGSSIAPLLLEGYEEITLVDLRYMKADYLPQLLELSEYDDVLFLYSENILRNSGSLKF